MSKDYIIHAIGAIAAISLMLSCEEHTIGDGPMWESITVDNDLDVPVTLRVHKNSDVNIISMSKGGKYEYMFEDMFDGVEKGKIALHISDSIEFTPYGLTPFKLYKFSLPQAVAPNILNDYWDVSKDDKTDVLVWVMTINQEMLDKVYGNK